MGKGKCEGLILFVIFSFLKSKSELKLECKYVIKQGNRYIGTHYIALSTCMFNIFHKSFLKEDSPFHIIAHFFLK